MPEQRGLFVVAAALGEQRQFAARMWAKFCGQAEIERLRAGRVGAIRIAAALQKMRQAKKIEAVDVVVGTIRRGQQCVDAAHDGREAAQIHLVVAHDRRQRGRQGRREDNRSSVAESARKDVFFAMPAELWRVQNVALQFDQAHGAEAQLP